MIDKNNIVELMSNYYENFYKNELGLPDWQERIRLRLNEEENYCLRFIDWFEDWFDYDFSGKKVLVVGCGTGGELVNFKNKGADIYGIEPNKNALTISHLKAAQSDIPKENITNGYSENLPYDENQFDFIYCYTVLEHVSDVEKSIKEMVRCAKVKGKIFIETPDYRQLYEGHYKLPLPMFLPIWMNKIIVRFFRRPSDFLDTINKVNSRQLQRIFNKFSVTSFRVFKENQDKMPKIRFRLSFFVEIIQYTIHRFFGVSRNQIWVLHKSEIRKSKIL
jgi:2-polyprenyl-3-methyl-5-hydroxy-6-metoxy-1,4-benzoquinol methylase